MEGGGRAESKIKRAGMSKQRGRKKTKRRLALALSLDYPYTDIMFSWLRFCEEEVDHVKDFSRRRETKIQASAPRRRLCFFFFGGGGNRFFLSRSRELIHQLGFDGVGGGNGGDGSGTAARNFALLALLKSFLAMRGKEKAFRGAFCQ